ASGSNSALHAPQGWGARGERLSPRWRRPQGAGSERPASPTIWRPVRVQVVRVLALDTSTPTTTCALIDDDRVVWESAHEPPLKAGDVLPAALGDLTEVQAIAVGLR